MTQCGSDSYRLEIGVRLRARRTALGLSRSEVAQALGVGPGRIGALERGEAGASVDQLLALAEILTTQIKAFLPEPSNKSTRTAPTPYELMARTDEGADLAEAFARIRTPRLRRHLAKLAAEIANQESTGGPGSEVEEE